jgi:uncharacterized tellurite resistance protein B-like protein
MALLDWLGLGSGRPEHDDDVVRRISRELDSLDPGVARYLALFAFTLARVANVDHHVSDEETREMERLVERFGGLSPGQASLVVEIAKTQNRLFGETQNFLAARELRDLATEEQKKDLLHCLFAVSAADDSISIEEEEAIREISRELLLTNSDYLSIRSAYRDKRSIFKDTPPAR